MASAALSEQRRVENLRKNNQKKERKNTMKRTLSLALALLMSLSLVACGGSNTPGTEAPNTSKAQTEESSAAGGGANSYGYDVSGEKPLEIVMTSALNNTHCCYAGFYEPFMALVTEMSDGKITWETYLAGELVEGGKEYDGLRDGIANVAMPLTPIYDTSRFPAGDIGQLPVKVSTSEIVSNAYVDLLSSEEIIADGKTFNELYFEDNGVHFIAHNNPPGNAISTTTKDITSMSSWEGLIIRTSSRPQQFLASELGIVPLNVTAYDLYDTLSRGTADGGFQQIPDWASYGLDELYKYAIEGLSFGHFTAGMGWSKSFWDSLPAVYQQIITDAADKVRPDGCAYWDAKTDEVKATVEGNGGKFVEYTTLPQDLQDKVNAACVNAWVSYATMLEESGVPGAKICKLWRDCMVNNGAEMLDGVDEALEQLLTKYAK